MSEEAERGSIFAVVDGIAAFGAMVIFEGWLSTAQMVHAATQLLRRQPLDAAIPAGTPLAKLTYVLDIKIDRVPRSPIIKMTRSEFAEPFVKDGRIRLGSINYFRAFEHVEVGDNTEGEAILIGLGPKRSQTVVRKVIGGLNEWIFCAFAGEPNQNVIAGFGYDAAIRIIDPQKFAQAISDHLNAQASHFARCIYNDSRTLVGPTPVAYPPAGEEPLVLKNDIADLVGPARAFLKPARYSHQREFRFTWTMPAGVDGVLDIICPEAAQYCEIVAK